MKATQYEAIARLLRRKSGATAMDMVAAAGTVCPHKRMQELRKKGWYIWREKIAGQVYGRYFGIAP